jgi:hypothetical protein
MHLDFAFWEAVKAEAGQQRGLRAAASGGNTRRVSQCQLAEWQLERAVREQEMHLQAASKRRLFVDAERWSVTHTAARGTAG